MTTKTPSMKRRSVVRQRSPGRPKKENAEALRQIYLQVALETFLDHGYAGTSIEEIARRAKASKVTLYRQFGNKAELFRLVTHHAISKVREKLAPIDLGEGNPKDELRDIIMRLHTGLTDPEYLAVQRMVISETERFPELGAALLRDDRFLFAPLVNYLTRATEEGELSIPNPYDATMQLAALASGGTRFLIKKPPRDPKRQAEWVDAILEFVLKAWKPRGKPADR